MTTGGTGVSSDTEEFRLGVSVSTIAHDTNRLFLFNVNERPPQRDVSGVRPFRLRGPRLGRGGVRIGTVGDFDVTLSEIFLLGFRSVSSFENSVERSSQILMGQDRVFVFFRDREIYPDSYGSSKDFSPLVVVVFRWMAEP